MHCLTYAYVHWLADMIGNLGAVQLSSCQSLSWRRQIKLKNMENIKKLSFVLFISLLINFHASGIEKDSVNVFEGRGVFKSHKVLDLSYRNLKTLPAEASNPEIEILILDNNNIEELPSWIGNLKSLRVLSIRNNNLLELNSAMTFCENLEQLYLSGNKNLSEIPSFSMSEKLEIIDVVDTRINQLPIWTRMMNSLYYFKFTELK